MFVQSLYKLLTLTELLSEPQTLNLIPRGYSEVTRDSLQVVSRLSLTAINCLNKFT